MRKYTLASPTAKTTVDLRDYADIIIDAVHAVMPSAAVKVEQDCYYVDPTPTQGSAIKIGRHICQSALKIHCIQIPKLFCSVEMDAHTKEENESGKNKQRVGGH